MKRFFEFSPFHVDTTERLLFRGGECVPLPVKIFDTLLVLLQSSGHILTKDELMEKIWPHKDVEENNLAQSISALRKVLGEGIPGGRCIETIRGRGYRFAARVEAVEEIVTRLPVRSIAVLPFRPLGAVTEDFVSLSLGVANALIIRLSKLGQITVRPTNTIITYLDQDQDLNVIGRRLGVSFLIEGTIETFHEKIRVTARLIRVRDGKSLWAVKFDGEFNDIFTLEDSISDRIMDELARRLGGNRRETRTKRDTQDAEAYSFYLKGQYFWSKRTEGGLKKSVAYFRRAVEKDPDYALAYTGLAASFVLLGFYGGLPPEEAFPESKAAALKALEIDDGLAEAYGCLAYTHLNYYVDWPGAEREFKRAIQADPNCAMAHHWYSDYLSAVGRFDEALKEIELAQEHDPVSLMINANIGLPYYWSRRYDQAIELFQRALEMDENFPPTHLYLGFAYTQKRSFEKAIAACQNAVSLSKGSPVMLAALGYAFAASGRTQKARQVLDQLQALSKQRYVPLYDQAIVYAGLGQKDQALRLLQQAVEKRSGRIVFLRVDPYWDGLSSDARFTDLLHQLRLGPAG